MSNMGLKTAIFNKNAIKYTKWPLLTVYNSWIWPYFFIKQNAILLKKKLFQMAYFKFQVKPPQGRTMHTVYPVNHLIKPPQRVLWDHTLIHSNHNISCWEISNFISCISFECHCIFYGLFGYVYPRVPMTKHACRMAVGSNIHSKWH